MPSLMSIREGFISAPGFAWVRPGSAHFGPYLPALPPCPMWGIQGLKELLLLDCCLSPLSLTLELLAIWADKPDERWLSIKL